MTIALALAVLGSTGEAQSSTSQLPATQISARFAGLAGASTAMMGHAGSVFVNPAGLPAVRVASLEGTYSRLADDGKYFMGAAAVRMGNLSLGGGMRYIQFGDGAPESRNLESVIALATHVRGVAVGIAANYFSVRDGDGAMARTLTGDAALTVAVFDIAALGLSVQNIGRAALDGPGVELPSTVHLGFSLNLIDTYSNGRLLATVEQVWGDDEERGLGGGMRVGLEGGAVFYGVGLVARVGVGPRTPSSPFSRGTWGGSLVFGRSAIDYAYLTRKAGGAQHLFGWRLTL
jgi:hypothetical protein